VQNGVNDDDGCPDADRDGDYVADENDQCPDVAEDADAVADSDGCPEDDDNDGVADADDNCRTTAGPVANSGCPDADRDRDSVIDRLDNCPDEAGEPANKGCKAKQLVMLVDGELKILDIVYFDIDKASIQKRSNKLLDNVAGVLKVHPELRHIEIAGHTDDVGDDAKNLDLSKRRAEAVKAYLVAKGVDAARLAAAGYGETKPLDSATTKAARAKNRRVEFHVK
jgi:outer membrane protein OmpA-like peptidoglycan-associated protein